MQKVMFRWALSALLLLPYSLSAQENPATDGSWAAQRASLQNTPEAAYMYRVGDIDNLGFGWTDDFDPFCGRTTEAHGYPWSPMEGDLPGLDRILISSAFDPNSEQRCASDGYSGTWDPAVSKPQPILLDMPEVKGKPITDAVLQLFIDDFQAPSFCSRYEVRLNDTRFVEAERLINAIEQGGPVGKLITLPIPEEFFPALQSGSTSLLIDEVSGAADGFAIDFVKVLINHKGGSPCIGDVEGFVLDLETHEPITDALVTTTSGSTDKTSVNGHLSFKHLPTGMQMLAATAVGYKEGFSPADIGVGSENEPVSIYLERDRNTATFDGQGISAGQVITLDKLHFDQGSAQLRPESKSVLDQLVALMEAHPQAAIELSGHTSSEGDAAVNRSLSYRRVKSCKEYVVAKGIDTGRITTIGLGPDRPAAPNDTEANRALNRRVELRILKL
jgi:outer membrane protein OmpA-like peptidoglycan-associated protein